ncbi:MAG: hypothetical protein ACI3VR_07970 [Intestinibacter sp.]|uniref:hypothetical protein n=1 Tax=Intestinibacter sp. TaxID=1965304 RepID=UPI003F13C9AF
MTAKEKIKLDEILKRLFTTSDQVLIKLLNAIFEENFNPNEVSVSITNSEFIDETLDVLRADMIFKVFEKGNSNFDKNKMNYHIEFQTKNDNTMVIRTFEYGFRKGKENSERIKDGITKLYFPKQKVIFFEENKNIEDQLKLLIIFSEQEEFLYKVDVIKYWQYSDEELIQKQMYPLIPLQLFNLRKKLHFAKQKNDIDKIKELSIVAKNLANKLANESKELFEKHEIFGEDFHKMLLSIQNLIEYLNRNYIEDESLEEEVSIMTKTLYDPEVEKRGYEKGKIEIILNMYSEGLDENQISKLTKIDIQRVQEIIKEYDN